jgi:hypothetical protein
MGDACDTLNRDMQYIQNFNQKTACGREHLGEVRSTHEDNTEMDMKDVWLWMYWLDSSDSGQGSVAGFCEHDGKICIP